MIEETTVYEAICDGCGKVAYDPDGPGGFGGYMGTVMDGTNYGEPVRWWACRERCVAKAPLAALKKAQQANSWGVSE